jgi:WD40 repeat protein
LGHEGFVEALAFSPDGKLFASASNDSNRLTGSAGSIYVWDVATGGKVKELGQKSFFSRGFVAKMISFSPDGMHLAAGSDSELRVWHVASWKQVARIKTYSLWGIAWST